MSELWDGQWVTERLGVGLHTDRELSAFALPALVGLALRRNPRRAHLLVSHVLGKHIPADPVLVHAGGLFLGKLIETILDGEVPVVLGYAETATGLGHAVADRLDADCLHSTRRAVTGMRATLRFEEAHSHARGHLLLPEDPQLLGRPGPVVLVDDELSTGATARNTIVALHELCPRERYLVAALVDVRSYDDRLALMDLGFELDTRIDYISTVSGAVRLPRDMAARAAEVVLARGGPAATDPAPAAEPQSVAAWPHGVKEGGRHGFTAHDRRAAMRAARTVARELQAQLLGGRVLVLGCEELMYAPMLVATELVTRCGAGRAVRLSSTTRSPVLAIDEPGYPVRTALSFPSHDGGPGERYAYNVAPAAGTEPFTDIVLAIDDVGDTAALRAPGGLLAQLATVCERVHLLVIPSYRPAVVPA